MPDSQGPRSGDQPSAQRRGLTLRGAVWEIHDLVARDEAGEAADLLKAIVLGFAHETVKSEPETVKEKVLTSKGRDTTASPGQEPPKWWPEHSQLQFDRCEDLQRRAWALLGLTAPLRPEEVRQFIENVSAGEREEGGAGYLRYEDPSDGLTRMVRAYSGWNEDELWERVEAEGLSDEDVLRRFELEHAARAQRLYRLAGLADRVRGRTGCRQEEAVAFLLCDEIPLCPWLDIEPDFTSGNLKIVVGTPLVPVAQVAALYRRLRPEMSALRSTPGGPRRASANPWPVRVPAFVNERKDEFRTTRGHDWPGLLDAFSAEYPDQPYTSAASFREMYYKFVRRERARGGGDTSNVKEKP